MILVPTNFNVCPSCGQVEGAGPAGWKIRAEPRDPMTSSQMLYITAPDGRTWPVYVELEKPLIDQPLPHHPV